MKYFSWIIFVETMLITLDSFVLYRIIEDYVIDFKNKRLDKQIKTYRQKDFLKNL